MNDPGNNSDFRPINVGREGFEPNRVQNLPFPFVNNVRKGKEASTFPMETWIEPELSHDPCIRDCCNSHGLTDSKATRDLCRRSKAMNVFRFSVTEIAHIESTLEMRS